MNWALLTLVLAEQALGEASPKKKLDRRAKARLLTAFLAALSLGVLLLMVVWVAARAARRYMHRRDAPAPPPPQLDDWASKPISPSDGRDSDE